MSKKKSFAAYLIHGFTALGAPLGLGAILFTAQGNLQWALYLLAAAVVIDSVDGTLARMLDISYYGWRIDGALLDNIIDYLNWTIAPLFWAFYALEVPIWTLLLAAFASSLGFSNQDAKTEDDFFLGFPSYWNIIVFYLFFFELGSIPNIAILLICAAATFVPFKFVYPSKTRFYRSVTLILGAIFLIQLVAMLVLFHQTPDWLLYSALLYPAYYIALSVYLNIKFPYRKSGT